MKRTIARILAAVLVLALLLPTAVFATNEGEQPEPSPTDQPAQPTDPAPTQTAAPTDKVIHKPSVTISASPSELVSEGTVSLNISVYNPNSFELANVAISVGGSTVKTISAIAGGSTYNYSGKYAVSAANLGKNIKVTVAYDGGSVSDSFKISQKDAKIKVNTIGKVDKTTVEQGETVNFSFSIENNSEISIENASLKASTLNGGARLGKTFSLAANGDATIILYTATITQTIDVSPVLTFTAGGKTYTKELDTITITVSDSNMEITAVPSTTTPKAGDSVDFQITVKNPGNVNFTNIALYDANDNRVMTSSNQLAAGGMLTATHTMTFTESGSCDFYVIASDAQGASYTFRSEPILMQVEEQVADYSEFFTLTAEVDDEDLFLKESGEVTVYLTLKNNFTEAFRDVQIVEANSGTVIETYSSFPVGEKVLPYAVEIGETTDLSFVLTATDPQGNPFTITTESLTITVEEKSGGAKLSTLLIILIIIIVLIIGCGVTLAILVIKEKKKKEAAEAQKIAEPRRSARISRVNNTPAKDVESGRAPARREKPIPTAAESEEDVKVYTRRPARRSYEEFIAEPEEKPEVEFAEPEQEEEHSEETPEKIPAIPEEPEIPQVTRRKHRDFEDRNLF